MTEQPARPAMTMREIRDRLGHARPDTAPVAEPARETKSCEELAIELMTTSKCMTHGEPDARRLLDQLRRDWEAERQPAPVDRRRTTWPSAVELQQAADTLRDVAPQIEGRLAGLADPVADWLDETANALSWLAPYRDNEPGYGMWETAMVVARKILGTTEQQPAADEAQQPEARPARHQWSVDMYDPGAETWLSGTPRCDRDEAAQHLERLKTTRSTWADGQPVRRRLVRSTTSYAVEDET
jgi:hypothetical protein